MDRRGTCRNMDSLPESLAVAFPSPEGSDTSPCKPGESGPSPSTPRKNKRKMTEPKKRHTDFSIKRFCPDSPRRDEVKESEVRGGMREYPPDTPDASPSPESPSSSGGMKSGQSRSLVPEASTREDLTAMRAYPLNIPMVPMPMTVTPPVTPRGKGVEQGHRGGVPQTITPVRGPSEHSLQGILTRHHRMVVPNLPTHGGMAPPLPPPSPSSSDSTNPTPHKTTSGIAPLPCPGGSGGGGEGGEGGEGGGGGGRRQRKNYKNMTRERRVEANARERTRVHTISAAFESLRRAVPSYSYNQRLSKLAILKIACSYILALGQLTEQDYTPGSGDNPPFGQSVDRCTQTIQAEGRTKRRH